MPRILVLEDSALSRRLLTKTLKAEGYDILEACNGLEGLAIIAHEAIDCILLDLLMPEMDGQEVLTILRQRDISIPVIVISADIQETTRQQCLELGVFAMLHKIVDPTQLLQTLDLALGTSSASCKS